MNRSADDQTIAGPRQRGKPNVPRFGRCTRFPQLSTARLKCSLRARCPLGIDPQTSEVVEQPLRYAGGGRPTSATCQAATIASRISARAKQALRLPRFGLPTRQSSRRSEEAPSEIIADAADSMLTAGGRPQHAPVAHGTSTNQRSWDLRR